VTDPTAERITIGTSGQPGRIVSMPVVEGSHSWDGFTWSPWVRQYGATVTKPQGRPGVRQVCITYLLQIWQNGAYVPQTSATGCSRFGGARAVLPRFDVPGLTRGNWFRMVHRYQWWNASRLVGTRDIIVNRPGEYVCRTRFDVCTVSASLLCLRAPYTGGCR
jgi:hypothetical protein